MRANKEECADKSGAVCDFNEFNRVRYARGMLLDDKDFQAEQQYHIGKRKFLNRMLHGSGVVCGLTLKGEKGRQSIKVGSGFALDCAGNEIWVSHSLKIDLTKLIPSSTKKNGECNEPDNEGPREFYIGIRYDEKPTNPVSIYLPSGGCDERTCENSRYREGYCIEIVECCDKVKAVPTPGLFDSLGEHNPRDPKEHPEATCGHCEGLKERALEECLKIEKLCEQSAPCPHCCSCEKACHVVLGKITVDDDCKLLTVCMNECRKYVFTAHLFQHLILSLVGEQENEKVNELAHNPIKALCELLQYIVVRKEKFTLPEFIDTRAQADTQAAAAEIKQVQEQMQAMMRNQEAMAKEMSSWRSSVDQKLADVTTPKTSKNK